MIILCNGVSETHIIDTGFGGGSAGDGRLGEFNEVAGEDFG